MTEAMIRKKPGMASVKDMPLLQDGPPPGGFAPVRYARRISNTGPSAMAIFLTVSGAFAWGMYQVGQGNKIRRALKEEKYAARRAILPVLQAEEDERFVSEWKKYLEYEADVMKDVPGWKVGENVYNSGRWMPPATGELRPDVCKLVARFNKPEFNSNISSGTIRLMVFDLNGGDNDTWQVSILQIDENILEAALQKLREAIELLRPLSLRMSIILTFSNLNSWRFQNPLLYLADSPHLYLSSSRSTVDSLNVIPLNRRRFSYKICAVMKESGGYGRTERGKRGRKRRELWEELFQEEEDDDDGGGGVSSGNFALWKILEEIVDNVWILKAFSSYGYLLPFILLSLFFSTGPKAFLVSLAIAIGPSLLFYAFQKLIGWDKRRRTSMANQFGTEEEEKDEEMERRSRVRYYNPSAVGNNVYGRGTNRGSAEMASKFGGWDELEGFGTISEQPTSEQKRKPLKTRKRVRRQKAAEPLLLRLLVSLFPFLSSYTNMLK